MRFAFLFILLVIFPPVSGIAQRPLPTGDVPAEFQSTYAELDSILDNIDAYLDAHWDGTKPPVTFSATLITANGNRGPYLLEPRALGGVRVTLDRLKTLGVGGVSIAVTYPLLVSSFPRSSEYLAFYRQVATEVRLRGMKMLIATGPAFTDSLVSQVPVDYSNLTFETYKKEKRAMIETILRELQPDFLTLETEPSTATMNTGLDFSVKNVTDVVNFCLSGLDRRGAKIGAGIGTWESMNYIRSLVNTGLDYIDVHVYPIQRNYFLDKVFTIADMARARGKEFVLGESWAYKIADAELGRISFGEIFARDVYSFWSPLDVHFLETIIKTAFHTRMTFCSFFWMQYFYAYLEYDQVRFLPAAQRISLLNQAAATNILLNVLSPTGEALQRILASITGVQQRTGIKVVTFEAPYPNPTASRTAVVFSLEHRSDVELVIRDRLGKVVRRVFGARLDPGRHRYSVSTADLAPGVYFSVLSAGRTVKVRKLVVTR